jgi:bifunctional UDP-N-acetylglucosamine pyrophosphorylase/glucosamine-1-phosphate N-acetyltransferase
MARLAAVVLAAGKSTRMKSKCSKVLHPLAGRPVVSYPIDAARGAGARPVIVVRGPDQNDLGDYLKGQRVKVALQDKPLGTAHALQSAWRHLRDFSGHVLVLCGDAPLVRAETITSFVGEVRQRRAVLGVITMSMPNPGAYGRVVRDLDGHLIRVVEAKEATGEELGIREVNSGIICAECSWLFKTLKRIKSDNIKGEYYLTDLVGCAIKDGVEAYAHRSDPAEEFLGINTRVDLARAAEIMRRRINEEHMLNGVGILDHRHTNVDADVQIGEDTTVMPYAFLLGKTKVGADCVIENGVVLRNASVGDGAHIKAYSVVEDSLVASEATVGPFARIRPGSKVGRDARVGNFVELKKCELKEGAKANHLTYLGDATVGARANVGCGTITCNYDGVRKYQTVIGEGAFIGSDTQFIAPVRIGKGATIGAGSTITRDVPADALALSRVDQKVVKGWTARRKKKR